MNINPTKEVNLATENIQDLSLSEIAYLVYQDWDKVYFGAVPYLRALRDLSSINDNYYLDSGESIVAYFLANASSWRGETAREVKKELNRRLKQKGF